MGSTPKYTACALFWSSTCSWSGLWQSDQCVHCGNVTHLVMSATRPRALRSSNNPARRWKLRHCRRSGRQFACALEDNEYKPWRVSRITSAGNGDDDGLRARRMRSCCPAFPRPRPVLARRARSDRDANLPLRPPPFLGNRHHHQSKAANWLARVKLFLAKRYQAN